MNAQATLRPAVPEDFPFIEGWRAAHFLEMQARQKTKRAVSGQEPLEDSCWAVYEDEGVPVAAIGFRDDAAHGIRYVTNLFTALGYARVGFRLGDTIEQMADDLGLEIRCDTDPENLHFLRILLKRGYEPSLVCLRRRPHAGRF